MGQTVVKTGATGLSGSTLIYSSAVAGVYSALIDLTPMSADTKIAINIGNTTIVASGTKVVTSDAFEGVQADPMFFQPPMHTNKGYSITIVLSSGTTLSPPFEITTF
tara:strand:- start:15754 stop:16074 length:321 start_codon:yes stop_codon:yes gene_type:complete